tara:strand:+ start:31876 stop:32151 length:276 start_codon:yes stop_codon:yes gene_type:complete
MNIKTKNIIIKFIKQKFPIKRIRDRKNKWQRVIITPSGYVRQTTEIYPIKRIQFHHTRICSDIIKTICYVFGFNQKDVEPLVRDYVNSIKT